MARQDQEQDQKDGPALCVVVTAGSSHDALADVLKRAHPASVIIAPSDSEPLTAANARPLVELVQSQEIAALIYGDAQLARTLRADGVHLPWHQDVVAQYGEARDILGTRYIVGIDVGRSRHDAMTLAEEGADYIGFGIPPHVEDREAAGNRRRELVAWWSEIFEVPCIALDVETPEEAETLSAAGADFIALVPSCALTADEFATLRDAIVAAAPVREEVA
ncbi:thiamine phosphate synthase [Hyphomicrobium sulfonivorans]|uniref:thiamine phosphate synthase n=1 Tax=Hyphomicrobium sulfonivorans TaxID=121290 RepID=UPI0015704169|nr:thiamine phosphate synthase [Hyphomicrobium sulfonivorans]MBI1649704.1 thiamine phosphate synthase [Hyphomicrobium sulfonivorans]NSL71619.1 thiamine phosphate synthase [Hyphomicrobium sulfonivorans]